MWPHANRARGCPFRGRKAYSSLLLFLRFGIVGLLNTAFGYVVFAGLCLTGLWPLAALVGSTLAGVAFNFQTSRRLVFRTRGRGLRFCLVYLLILAANWALLRMMNDAGFNAIEAQAVLALPLSIASFVGQKVFVFGIAGEQG